MTAVRCHPLTAAFGSRRVSSALDSSNWTFDSFNWTWRPSTIFSAQVFSHSAPPPQLPASHADESFALPPPSRSPVYPYLPVPFAAPVVSPFYTVAHFPHSAFLASSLLLCFLLQLHLVCPSFSSCYMWYHWVLLFIYWFFTRFCLCKKLSMYYYLFKRREILKTAYYTFAPIILSNEK